MVFLVVTYGCERWTIKKPECQIIYAFKLWCWRRLLRLPWTARRSNQSLLKEISPEYSLEGLMLKLQYFGHLRWSTYSLGKSLMGNLKAGGEGATENEMVGWHHWLNGHEFEQTPGDPGGQRTPAYCSHGMTVRHTLAAEQQLIYMGMKFSLCV